MDPFALLGVDPDAGEDELHEAYRRQAKRWHPDLRPGPEAQRRMAKLNAAYDAARHRAARPPRGATTPATGAPAASGPARGGSWLPEAVRRTLGRELLGALHPGEDVRLVTPAATWASPRALLAVTDRRLLWLLDDAVSGRVRSVRFSAIADVEHRATWPRRRAATLRLRTRSGRRLAFAGLRPDTAARIAHQVAAATG